MSLDKQQSPLHGPPKGHLWREMPVFRAFIYISFRAPSKGAPPPCSPHRAPIEWERCSFPEPSFICLSEFPVNTLCSRFPNGASMNRDAQFQSRLLHISWNPQWTRSSDKTKSHLPLQVPGKKAPPPPTHLWSPNRAPIERNAWSPQPVVYSYLSESPVKEPSHETWGKHMVTIHGAPSGQKAYIQRGVAWFPKGIVYETAVTTQWHAAISTIFSTLVWIDQSPVSKHVSHDGVLISP